MPTHWWQRATVYQIYPRSFQDSNGDGIGDLCGVIQRLDYLARLGIDVIWLCPVYASPMLDNGYDVSDYCAIAPEFGTMADMQALIQAANARGIKIIMDLVLNHTSDQHNWFVQARSSRTNPYRNFYIWRDADNEGKPPKFNPKAYFGGSMWQWDELTEQFYFHQFSNHQPDLNWRNPDVQQAIHKIIQWWRNQGIAGFRLDVIDLIGKDVDAHILANGPRLHMLLKDMNEACFDQSVMTVGEVWSATPETAKLLTSPERKELSMLFQFEHILQLHHPDYGKWQPKAFDVIAFKTQLNKWQSHLGNAWLALFWSNHDLPRTISTFGDDVTYPQRSAKALAILQFTLAGTPFIYQGEELAMSNYAFQSIDQCRDIESHHFYQEGVERGEHPSKLMQAINAHGRDQARTPMQWSTDKHAGFSSNTPWISINDNVDEINAGRALINPDSVYYCYQKLIALRKQHDELVDGSFTMLAKAHVNIVAYLRQNDQAKTIVVVNLSRETSWCDLRYNGNCLISSCIERTSTHGEFAPYEALVLQCN